MTLLAFPSLQTIFDANARPVRAAKAYFYASGTVSPIQVHKVATLDSAYTQPVLTAPVGRFPPIFTNAASYRVRITDQWGGIIEDIDGISGTTDSSGGGGGSIPGVIDANSLLLTGDILFNLVGGTRVGFVRLNARTISKGAGGGTERANDDAHALYLYLWNAMAGLVVIGGRGADAEADWSAPKQLTLPDMRGRGPLGVDAMGSTAAGRFTGGLLSTGGVDAVGSVGGEAATTAPLPVHAHMVNGFGSGIENQSFTHSFSGTTLTANSHSHGINRTSSAGPTVGSFVGGFGVGVVDQTAGVSSHSHPFSGTTGTQNSNHNHQIPAHQTVAQGTGGAHNTLPPFMLGTWLIRL